MIEKKEMYVIGGACFASEKEALDYESRRLIVDEYEKKFPKEYRLYALDGFIKRLQEMGWTFQKGMQ